MVKVPKSGSSYLIEEVRGKSNIHSETYTGNKSVDTPNHNGSQNNYTTKMAADTLFIESIGQAFIENFWGETITTSAPIAIELNSNGSATITRQYIYTAAYRGHLSDYEIKGSVSWNSFGGKALLDLTFDIYYSDDEDGIAKTSSPYLYYHNITRTFT